MTNSSPPSVWTTPLWLVPTSEKTSRQQHRRRRILTSALALGTISTLSLGCYSLMPPWTLTSLSTLVPSLTTPPPPQHELFGIPNLAGSVDVAFLDIYFNETKDEHSIPVAQDLGVDLGSAFTTFQLDSPDMANSTLTPEEYIRRQRGGSATITRTATAQIARRPHRPADASHMMFGLATSLDRIPGTVRNVARWAAGTGARFVVVLIPRKGGNDNIDDTPSSIAEAEALFAAAGVPDVTFVAQEQESWQDAWENAYMSLITHFHAALSEQHHSGSGGGSSSKARWVSWVDDDTFFPRLSALTAALDTRFDAREPQYVGQTSERYEYVRDGGLVAFGGAGIFLSVPLLDQLLPHAAACRAHRRRDKFAGGDFRLADCIHRWTAAKLSPLEGLHQLDFGGDASGFYEAERPQPLSVHHWKSWHAADMPGIARVGEVCGEACVLQHFRLGGRGGAGGGGGGKQWAMTNGFSIVRYSDGYRRVDSAAAARDHEDAEEIDGAMEKTWDTTRGDAADMWKYSLEPLMDRDAGKRQYMMERMDRDADGNMVVDYVHRENGVGRGLVRVRLMAI
ncbi:DUF604 domain-containing protein [Microdochium nivale]|nr:DUF604 domain-containing protein [Microdochium nivale]